jgi:hypothetical protein
MTAAETAVKRYMSVLERLYPDPKQQMIYTQSLLEKLAETAPDYMAARSLLLEERAVT